jgi:hypothetical protein
MALKLKKEFEIALSMNNMMEDEYGVALELSIFASNIKKKIREVLDGFFSFLRMYEKKKVHNMLFLNSRFKNILLIENKVTFQKHWNQNFQSRIFLNESYD